MGSTISHVYSAAQIAGWQAWVDYCGCPEPRFVGEGCGQNLNGYAREEWCALAANQTAVGTPRRPVKACGKYNSWFESGCLYPTSPSPICRWNPTDWCQYNADDGLWYFYKDFTN